MIKSMKMINYNEKYEYNDDNHDDDENDDESNIMMIQIVMMIVITMIKQLNDNNYHLIIHLISFVNIEIILNDLGNFHVLF